MSTQTETIDQDGIELTELIKETIPNPQNTSNQQHTHKKHHNKSRSGKKNKSPSKIEKEQINQITEIPSGTQNIDDIKIQIDDLPANDLLSNKNQPVDVQQDCIRCKYCRREIIDPENGNITAISTQGTENNWTDANTSTLRNWKQSLAKASFMYQYVLEGAKNKLNNILLIALILSTASSVISGISSLALTVDNPSYKLAALIINIIVFIISVLITFLNGAIKIYKWDEIVTNYTAYIEKMDQLYSIIAHELVLPSALRDNAVDFIKTQGEIYLNLIRQSPDIDSSLYREANKEYIKFLQDDTISFKCSRKYKMDDSVIEVA